jgi:putative radical SAM enzyme (TIGR03279 family)
LTSNPQLIRIAPVKLVTSSEHGAGITQLVEYQLPKLRVAGSNPVARSTYRGWWGPLQPIFVLCSLALGPSIAGCVSLMLVTRVSPTGFASDVNIKAGDKLISVDGQPLRDRLDMAFAESGKGSILKLRTASGRLRRLRLPKALGEDLGFELEQMKPRVCDNKCVFCFIHQLPKGMRRSLYVKDEDYRYSFLFGNFVTLTNIDSADVKRIVRQKLSPLYVSVHATDEAVRRKLLGNSKAPELLPLMRRLAGKGVKFHCQVVLCPGLNDGAVLAGTVGDLAAIDDAVLSVGVVPVGLTDHRRGLPRVDTVSRGLAKETVRLVEDQQRRFRDSLGRGFVYASDELFLKAGLPIPPSSYYDGYPQKENGVGIARLWLDGCKRSPLGQRAVFGVEHMIVVTGTLAAPLVAEGLKYKLRRYPEVSAQVCPVPNRFLGRGVTVAGLLAGRDIVRAVSMLPRPGVVCIPPDAVNADGLLLDDMNLAELASRLDLEVRVGLRGRSVKPRERVRAGAA